MRPPACECENRTHDAKKIGPSQYSDFFNKLALSDRYCAAIECRLLEQQRSWLAYLISSCERAGAGPAIEGAPSPTPWGSLNCVLKNSPCTTSAGPKRSKNPSGLRIIARSRPRIRNDQAKGPKPASTHRRQGAIVMAFARLVTALGLPPHRAAL